MLSKTLFWIGRLPPENRSIGDHAQTLAVEGFLKDKDNVIRLETSEVEFTRAELPTSPQIMVLKPAL